MPHGRRSNPIGETVVCHSCGEEHASESCPVCGAARCPRMALPPLELSLGQLLPAMSAYGLIGLFALAVWFLAWVSVN